MQCERLRVKADVYMAVDSVSGIVCMLCACGRCGVCVSVWAAKAQCDVNCARAQ